MESKSYVPLPREPHFATDVSDGLVSRLVQRIRGSRFGPLALLLVAAAALAAVGTFVATGGRESVSKRVVPVIPAPRSPAVSAVDASAPADSATGTPRASMHPVLPAEVVVNVRTALLREKPEAGADVVAKLPLGTHLTLTGQSGPYYEVEVPADSSGDGAKEGPATAYLSRQTVSSFAAGHDGSQDMIAAGRALADNPSYRPVSAAFLLRGTERLRQEGAEDPEVEVELGEEAEALASSGGPFPEGLQVTKLDAPEGDKVRYVYSGAAFAQAFAAAEKGGDSLAGVRDRARIGILRAKFAQTGTTDDSLAARSDAWLDALGELHDSPAIQSAADRAGEAVLPLARGLLSAGKIEDLSSLDGRIQRAVEEVSAALPGDAAAEKFASRAALVKAMRGAGGVPVPQSAKTSVDGQDVAVSIETEGDHLQLVVTRGSGESAARTVREGATPVLPVPGSLEISSDGKSAAWLEVRSDSVIGGTLVRLDGQGPPLDLDTVGAGVKFPNLLTTLSGFSKGGDRLGFSVKEWRQTQPKSAHLFVVSSPDGVLLFETRGTMAGRERQARMLR
jgi:hypothetical protein